MFVSPPSSPPAKRARRATRELNEEEVAEQTFSETHRTLEEIDECQNLLDAISEKSCEAILNTEKRYNEKRKPLFEKRTELIERLPNFWVTVLVNHPLLTSFMDFGKEDCLHYLQKLDVEDFEETRVGYRIRFFFAPNPYFENDVLVKELHLGSPASSKSSRILWKEGKNLITKNKRKKKKSGDKRHLEPRTFFDWFVDHVDPSMDEIAEVFKEDVWPNPLQYYLSSNVDFDANGAEFEDDDEADVDVEDDEESESEEEDDGDKQRQKAAPGGDQTSDSFWSM